MIDRLTCKLPASAGRSPTTTNSVVPMANRLKERAKRARGTEARLRTGPGMGGREQPWPFLAEQA